MTSGIEPDFNRLASLIWTNPVIARVREVAEQPVYLVGGAIRDGLSDFPVDDIDLVVEGDPVELALKLDPEARINDRFGTVNLMIGADPVDLATARTETYAHPGALPEVTPGRLEDDLRRRDFTINSMAVPIDAEAELIDPFGGIADLRSGVLRVLHADSFTDDPTRAFRAARYAARFGFDLEPGTAELMLGVNPATVSRERIENELRLISLEETALDGMRLVGRWGLIELDESRLRLASDALGLVEDGPWKDEAPRGALILEAVFGDSSRWSRLIESPDGVWEAYQRARGQTALTLILARAAGARWLDQWQGEWRWVELEITGADLLAAGVPEGPRIGDGLDAALRAKLEGDTTGADSEMNIALEAAGMAK